MIVDLAAPPPKIDWTIPCLECGQPATILSRNIKLVGVEFNKQREASAIYTGGEKVWAYCKDHAPKEKKHEPGNPSS